MALETEIIIGLNPKSKRQHHHHHHLSFESTVPQLYNVMTKQVVPKVIEEDILKFETRRGGGNAMKLFVQEHICVSDN